MQINSSPTAIRQCCLFPLLFPASRLPQTPAASRGEATSLLGSPSPWHGGRQQRTERPPSFLFSGLFQGLQPNLSQLHGGVWGAFPCCKQKNLGLGKGGPVHFRTCLLPCSSVAGLPGKGAPLGARAGSSERGDGDWSKVTSLGEVPGGWLIAKDNVPPSSLNRRQNQLMLHLPAPLWGRTFTV